VTDFFTLRDQVWDTYLGELERNVGSSSDLSLLQPYRTAYAFYANMPEYPNFTKFVANRVCNVVTDFSATARADCSPSAPIYTGTTLTERYGSFLQDVSKLVTWTQLSKDQQATFDRLVDEENRARAVLVSFDGDLYNAWLVFKVQNNIPSDANEAQRRMDWESYYGYDQRRRELRNAVFGRMTERWNFMYSILPLHEQALRTAIEYWSSANYEEHLPPSPLYERDASYNSWGPLKRQTLSIDYAAFFRDDAVRQLTISTTSAQSSSRATHWNGSGGWNLGFFSIGGNAGGSSDERHMQSNTTAIEVSFKRLEQVEIVRAPWFQPLLFKTYGLQLNGYWGPGGLLSCFPTHIILGRGLTVKLHMNRQAKDTFRRHVGGSSGLSIGPFSIGGSSGSDTRSESHTEQDFGWLISDASATARILAVRVERPNYRSVTPEELETLLKSKAGA
jgi:hypothetical protein